MVSYVIGRATVYSESIGCRVVMLNPEPDAIEFYEKQGFNYIKHNNKELDSMFVDIKQG